MLFLVSSWSCSGCSAWSRTTTLGGWLHVLLVVAVVFLLIRVIRGVYLSDARPRLTASSSADRTAATYLTMNVRLTGPMPLSPSVSL